MAQLPPEEERFHKNCIAMVSLVQHCVRELNKAGHSSINDLTLSMASTVISSFDHTYLIQGFIENSHVECWDQIKKRDEDFFLKNASSIFKQLPVEQINLFADLFRIKDVNGNSVIPQADKDKLWAIFDAMIKICIKYVHRNRAPYSKLVDSATTNLYHNSFFDEVDVNYHATNWGLKLDFPAEY